MQLVHEAALCVNRIRRKEAIAHQGFELLNGLPWVASDEQIHQLLDGHSVGQALDLQKQLMGLRCNAGHYHPSNTLAVDPHRLLTSTNRITPKKKKKPGQPARKTLQTFFVLDVHTGQPLIFDVGTAGKTVTQSTTALLEGLEQASPAIRAGSPALLLADSEYMSRQLLEHVAAHPCFDMILPAAKTKTLSSLFPQLSYQYQWAGFAMATSPFRFTGSSTDLTLLVQRDGERRADYTYKAFITTSPLDPVELTSILYPKRWTIEEFFNFEQAMGWKRASTMNLNIRYGRMSLALIGQAAMYQLRKQLPKPYRTWTAEHLAKTLFNSLDGDIRVRDDRIVVTIYNAPPELGLPELYSRLPEKLAGEGVDPRMPWLYDFKLDFDFK